MRLGLLLTRLCGLSCCLLMGCGPSELPTAVPFSPAEHRRLLTLGPLGPLPDDPTNRVADDPRAAELGEALFFEPRLSPAGVACVSCHPPAAHFTADSVQFAATVTRQIPSLWNTGFHRWWTWDGRKDSLWSQVLGPLEHPLEMASDRTLMAHVIFDTPRLRDAYESLFGTMPPLDDTERFPDRARPARSANAPDALGAAWQGMRAEDQAAVQTVAANSAKAIAAFERRLISGPTRVDRFVEAVRLADEDGLLALSPTEQRGLQLFVGDAQCFLCHTGALFSDREFHNLGLAARPESMGDLGRIAGVDQVLRDPFNALGEFSDETTGEAADKVRFLRASSEQEGQFKTPSLRNVALTPPYMHDGRFATLEEVVQFYNELGQSPPYGHTEDTLRPLGLSADDQTALVAFLRALTQEETPPDIARLQRLDASSP